MKTIRNTIYKRARLLIVALVFAGYGYPAAATLLGVEPTPPIVLYNTTGTTTYTAATDQFSIDASPTAINTGSEIALINAPMGGSEGVDINIVVDETGSLVGGVAGDDLIVIGEVTLSAGTFSGVLLTGEITDFGFSDPGGTTDLFDFLFTTTGGALSGLFGSTIGATLTSESSTFNGSFSASFGGEAKGNIGSGSIPPTEVAEPAILVLFGIGLAGLGITRGRKK